MLSRYTYFNYIYTYMFKTPRNRSRYLDRKKKNIIEIDRKKERKKERNENSRSIDR